MKISTKVTGLTLAGLTTAGLALAAIETGGSTSVAGNVSQTRHYSVAPTASGTTGQAAPRQLDADRRRHRPGFVSLTSRYAVTHVRAGRPVPVLRKIGNCWRVVGTLRRSDRRVLGATVAVRRTTTVVVVVGHRAVTLAVPPHAAVVVADNGRIGVVSQRFLRKIIFVRPTMSPTPAPTTSAPMTPPTMAPTPTPSGSQSPVVGGLQNRTSTKW